MMGKSESSSFDAKRRQQGKRQRSRSLEGSVNNYGDVTATKRTESDAPAAATRRTEKVSLLLQLSQSCNKHQEWHNKQAKKTGSSNDNNNADKYHHSCCAEQEEEAPVYCREALTVLRRVLPKVEHKYRASESSSETPLVAADEQEPGKQHHRQHKGPAVQDVGHICDFYSNVLEGGFCPHAPHLFRSGQEGTEILPRVHFLFQHLASRSVINNYFAASKSAVPSMSMPPRPVLTTITSTIAHLLSFIPQTRLQRSALRDLIHLIADFSALAESGVLDPSSPDLKTDVAVEALLFQETIDESALPGDTEYAIRVRNLETLFSLQLGTLETLEALLRKQKQKRLDPPEDLQIVVMEECDDSSSDLYFHGLLLEDADSIRTFLGTARHILLTPVPSDHRLRRLSIRSKECASNLLLLLLEDYQRIGVPDLPMLLDVNLLIVRAILEFFQWKKDKSGSDDFGDDCEIVNNYARTLSALLGDGILFPPRVQCSFLPKEIEFTARKAALSTLFDCAKHIIATTFADGSRVNNSGVVTKEAACRDLEALVLRTIYVTLYDFDRRDAHLNDSIFSPSANLFIPKEVTGNLFRLLGDPTLSDSAAWIVFTSACRNQTQTTWLTDIASICHSFMKEPLEMVEGNGVAEEEFTGRSTTMEVDLPSPGTKRKKPLREPQHSPISFETSNKKRQKNNRNKCDSARLWGIDDDNRQNACSFSEGLGTFLLLAYRSGKKLRTWMRGSGQVPAKGSNVANIFETKNVAFPTKDVANVCSAVRILILILRESVLEISTQSLRMAFSYLVDLLKFLIEALNILCSSFLLNLKSNTIRSSIHPAVNTLVSCGVHCYHFTKVNNTKYLSNSELAALIMKAVRPLLESTENLYNALDLPMRSKVLLQQKMPSALSETIYNLGIHSCCPGDGSTGTLRISIFDKHTVLMRFARRRVFPVCAPFLLSLLTPMVEETESQEARLAALAEWTHKIHKANLSLHQMTIELIRTVDENHADPIVRLLSWKCIAWLFLATRPRDLRQLVYSNDTKKLETCKQGIVIVKRLVKMAVADPDEIVRGYTSIELGSVVSANGCRGLFAILGQEEDWELSLANSDGAISHSATAQIAARLFHEVDSLLHNYCSMPESQLSLTICSSSSGQREVPKTDSSVDTLLMFQRAAIRALTSICKGQNTQTICGRIIFEQSILRIVRLWSGIGNGLRLETRGLSFGGLSDLSRTVDIGGLLREASMPSFIPALFRDVLVPSSGFFLCAENTSIEAIPLESREKQYRLLCTFIQVFLTATSDTKDIPFIDSSLNDIEVFLELCLPFVISQLVVDKDYDALKLTTGFKLFILSQKKQQKKTGSPFRNETDLTLGSSRFLHAKAKKSSQWARNLERQTRELCLTPMLVERILPSIFMKAGRSELVFFTKHVLQNKMTLNKMMSSRGPLILKRLVWELGNDVGIEGSAVRAIKTAAIAKMEGPNSTASVPARRSTDHTDTEDSSAASEWVTSEFMFLLVNLIQHGWNARPVRERARAVRCLASMVDFLRPSESAQYFPHIMATVNAAIAQQTSSTDKERYLRMQMRRNAVEILSKFTSLVVKHQPEILGRNLASLVVSLIPVLDEDAEFTDPCEDCVAKETRNAAVALLEHLTQGELGKKLAKFFKEIPFLPPSPALNSVRLSLQKNGVDFDQLQVTATQGTQQDNSYRDSNSSDAGSMGSSSRSTGARRQGALRRRLKMLCSLLNNENASLRRAVLQHLTGLLRANRDLFYALAENEGAISMNRYITKAYPGAGFSRGAVTEVVEALLARCVHEDDAEGRILLATCIGEVGAIGHHRLEEATASPGSGVDTMAGLFAWRSSQPPWKSSQVRYELQLVTKLLVVAIKAAPASNDQHKIIYTIQQLLVLLDKSASDDKMSKSYRVSVNEESTMGKDHINKTGMSEWLASTLTDAGVFEIVEPFWFSEFCEIEGFSAKQAPFFQKSTSYFSWISNWCRFMVHRSNIGTKTKWNGLFYACRTALRTQAGMSVAEFLLPLLVLDRICFGDGHDEQVVVNEIREALTFDGAEALMNQSERRKAVSTVFMVIDTLQHWSETAIEEQEVCNSRKSSSRRALDRRSTSHSTSQDWPEDKSRMCIDGVLQSISLALRAHAAFSVGMQAAALRWLEMSARAQVVDQVFNNVNSASPSHTKLKRSRAAGSCSSSEMSLMKDVLAALNDYGTIQALNEDDDFRTSLATRTRDSIRQKEAYGDWEGALQDYEQAQQLNSHDKYDPILRRGALQCLLKLGHFESVLNQFNSSVAQEDSEKDELMWSVETTPLAIEASWRLGRWETLSRLLDLKPSANSDSDSSYQISLGHTMLGLHKKNPHMVSLQLRNARSALMEGLSSVARESYSRAYHHIVRLHSLREIEDAAESLCAPVLGPALGTFAEEFCWNSRLDIASPAGETTIINARLALARLAGDSSLEGSLFLNMGKRARKNALFNIATNSFAKSEEAFGRMNGKQPAGLVKCTLRIQVAKLKHDCGENSTALRMLCQEDVETKADLEDKVLLSEAGNRVRRMLQCDIQGMNNAQIKDIFVRTAFLSTQWMIEGGLKGGAEIMGCFRTITRVAPKWEKGHFKFAKYVDSVMQSRVLALQRRSHEHYASTSEDQLRSRTIAKDGTCQKFVLLALKHYANSLALGTKNVYQALPRLLTLWFDFTSIRKEEERIQSPTMTTSSQSFGTKANGNLAERQDEANQFMAKQVKHISSQIFYTAMPQLISRVIHDDLGTALVVRGILRRVLTKFVQQAMWPLAWLMHSRLAERRKIGTSLFKDAEKALLNHNKKNCQLLVASKGLFSFLQELARHEPRDHASYINVKAWRGETDLCEFVPPIQAALSISLPSCLDNSRSFDNFPRHVPRMRAFNTKVGVMTSKARPKKLKVFVVSPDSVSRFRDDPKSAASASYDLGELHFLVKQEARGDLRKDARVQDLNNVINRLMASSNDSKGSSQHHRRLHLRTFEVTCLSEDTGILEWVPNTESMRNLVTRSYNPQALPFSPKRRGRRIADFGDSRLRNNFEKQCQDVYFLKGNLKGASARFEELCLKPNPPLLYWWFVQKFHDPHAWYEARTRFSLSCAVWSGVGHVIGLGDRHSENILVDTSTGECVHVDFDCIFDKGLTLPKPEVVPFRLTQNLVDAFGPTGVDGSFTDSLKEVIGTLRDNRDTLLSVLEPFIKDPVIDWKRYRNQQQKSQRKSKSKNASNAQDRHTKEAKRSINVIDERLKGIYNLRNPNLRKIRRTDGIADQHEDNDLAHLLPLSVEGQVHKMIAEATKSENLVQLYVGWMPWI